MFVVKYNFCGMYEHQGVKTAAPYSKKGKETRIVLVEVPHWRRPPLLGAWVSKKAEKENDPLDHKEFESASYQSACCCQVLPGMCLDHFPLCFSIPSQSFWGSLPYLFLYMSLSYFSSWLYTVDENLKFIKIKNDILLLKSHPCNSYVHRLNTICTACSLL